MRATAYLLKQGVEPWTGSGDGRQSGTSGSPSILNASPEAADNGGLALLQTGDTIRIDLNTCTANILVSDEVLQERLSALVAAGGFPIPVSQSPWQQYFREMVEPLSEGMTLRDAPNYQDIARNHMPRDNH
jgi:dihydroxy-acid dehydratase